MVMQLLQLVITNIFADLDDNSGSRLFSVSTDPVEATTSSSLEGSSNMEQIQGPQGPTVLCPESTSNRHMTAPLCVKIGALETLEVLFNVGGSFRSYSWRTEMDWLLIDVARDASNKAVMYEGKAPWINEDDPSISDLQLASLKALLASFLSSPHERPPHLEQGLELFNKGMLETGTELGNFCSHALLALDVLIHPRQLPPHGVACSDLGFRSAETEQPVFGPGILQPPCSVHKRGAPEMDQSAAPGSSSTGVKTADGLCHCNHDAGSVAVDDPPDSSSVHPAPVRTTAPDSRNHENETTNNGSGIRSGEDASCSQNVPTRHTSPAVCDGSDWDPMDLLLDIGDDADAGSQHGW